MSANADSLRFKLACNVHDWAYFEKNIILLLYLYYYNPEKQNFYIKLPMVMGRTFLVSNFL